MNILAIGAHPDDVELGCFGTLAKLKSEGHEINILVCSNGEAGGNPGPRRDEAKRSAGLLGAKLFFGNLPDTRMSDGIETINVIETVMRKANPDIIFASSPKDIHQDHRNLSRAVMSATRNGPNEVYFYESPSTSRAFNPSVFFDVTDFFDIKMDAVAIHRSQGLKSYMAGKAVAGLAAYHAYELGINDRLVEAFEPSRILRR